VVTAAVRLSVVSTSLHRTSPRSSRSGILTRNGDHRIEQCQVLRTDLADDVAELPSRPLSSIHHLLTFLYLTVDICPASGVAVSWLY
jgi:hypothetical protein